MSLHRESRWSRLYRSADGLRQISESRFLDGTATVTLSELEAEWPRWDQHERLDFCQAFHCAIGLPDRADILRFLMKNGDQYVWSTIATGVAMSLPETEAVPFLKQRCLTAKVGDCANYFQALALIKAGDALEFLRDCFSRIWNTDGLLADADFCNQVAFDAVCCLQFMIELGEDIETLRPAYETLKRHPCAMIRDRTQRWLSKDFES